MARNCVQSERGIVLIRITFSSDFLGKPLEVGILVYTLRVDLDLSRLTFVFAAESGGMSKRCSCTPGYTCKGRCILKEIRVSPDGIKKRAYENFSCGSFERVASKKQHDRMDYAKICSEMTDYAVNQKCCNGKCLHRLVEKYNIFQVGKAVQLAREDVYHTNANCAHSELRDLLKFGQCATTGYIQTYFDHKEVFQITENTPRKLKVRRCADSLSEP